MKLVSVYDPDARDPVAHLWRLLSEREPEQSISHKAMPTMEEHFQFVGSLPYLAWYLVVGEVGTYGCCYLTKQREIGVSIYRHCRGRGFGQWAVRALMEQHPGRFLANIAPGNTPSVRLFKGLGFKMIQHTYEAA